MKKLLTVALWFVTITVSSQSFVKTYHFLNSSITSINGAVVSTENGFTFVAFDYDKTGNYIVLVQTDPNGDTIRTRKVFHNAASIDNKICLICDSEGNFIFSLPHASDEAIQIVKLDPKLDEVWRRNLGIENTNISALFYTMDGNILISSGKAIIELDNNGNTIWQQLVNGVNLHNTYTRFIVESNSSEILLYNHDIVVSGSSGPSVIEPKLRIYSKNGVLINEVKLPETTISGIKDNGNIICLASSKYNTYDNYKHMLFKQDMSGLIFAQKMFNLSSSVVFRYLIENSEGNLIAFGSEEFNKRFVIHCMSKEGDSIWTNFIDNEKGYMATDFKLANDGGFVISIYGSNSEYSFPGLIKTDTFGNVFSLGINEKEKNFKVIVSPNPADTFVSFNLNKDLVKGSILITDISGKEIVCLPINSAKVTWDTAGVKPGLYLYKIDNKSLSTSGKILIK